MQIFYIIYFFINSVAFYWKVFENFIVLNSSGKLEILRKFEFKENFSNLVKAFLISAILEKLGFKNFLIFNFLKLKN